MGMDSLDNTIAEALENAVKKCRQRHYAKLIRMRNKGKTFKEIGKKFGFTAQRANAIYKQYKNNYV